MRVVRHVAYALALIGAFSEAAPADSIEQVPLTVANALQTTRLVGTIVGWQQRGSGTLAPIVRDVLVSPNGKRYVTMLVRGDLERNGNWIELAGGELTSLKTASHVSILARFFTSSYGSVHGYGLSALTSAQFNPITWVDEGEKVALLLGDGQDRAQVAVVNVLTGDVQFVTTHPTDVRSFSVGPDGAIAFSATVPHADVPAAEFMRRGFVVTNTDAFSFLRGEFDGYGTLDRMWNTQTFITTKERSDPRMIVTNRRGYDLWAPHLDPKFSPDGRFVIVDGTPDEIPESWNRYDSPTFEMMMRDARHNRSNFNARFIKTLLSSMFINGTTRQLWDVPNAMRIDAAWSSDSRRVLLGPTFLPSHAEAGRSGDAIAELDVATGQFWQVPVRAGSSVRFEWLSLDVIGVDTGVEEAKFKKVRGEWIRIGPWEPGSVAPKSRIAMELRQDINEPPVLFAVDTRTGRAVKALDLNPQLRKFTLGQVENFEWSDSEGRVWRGLLYYPVHFTKNRSFPLVIQAHDHAHGQFFSLYGPGFPFPTLGPGYSIYSAQALANRDIAVLEMEEKDIPGTTLSPREPELYSKAYEAAVRQLVAMKVVNPKKVGLSGFSRAGWYVEYALTHSDVPYAAAITSDNFDGGYLQSLLSNADQEFDQVNGAAPFGEGLQAWFQRAPGFNAERIRTPLRLQVESGGLSYALSKWEMFVRLRRLGKPVELYIIPEIERGSHALQNPKQCQAAQEGAVDWFDFWLNDHEDASEKKDDQYVRWRALRDLKRDKVG